MKKMIAICVPVSSSVSPAIDLLIEAESAIRLLRDTSRKAIDESRRSLTLRVKTVAALSPSPRNELPMLDDEDAEDEAVGYKKPPKKGRFCKNRSGNPGGRPKKQALNSDERLIGLVEAKVPNSDYTVFELLLKSTIKSAAQGDMKAVRFLYDNYVVAKGRRRSKTSDEDGDRAIVERILGADHPLVKEIDADSAPTGADTPLKGNLPHSDG